MYLRIKIERGQAMKHCKPKGALRLVLALLVCLLLVGCGSGGSKVDGIDFDVRSVRNDTTGNWRIALIAEDVEVKDIACDYYKACFKSDSELHFIVNFNTNTTASIAVTGDTLHVTVREYVSGEEHDAKLLGGGTVLGEYYLDKSTGEPINLEG